LHRDDRSHRPLLARGLGKPLGVRHHVARAAVDSLQRDADWARAADAAVRRGPVFPAGRARAAFRDQTVSPTTQGLLVLVATLVILLSGAPVAFGLGALSLVFLILFQGVGALQVVAETFYS